MKWFLDLCMEDKIPAYKLIVFKMNSLSCWQVVYVQCRSHLATWVWWTALLFVPFMPCHYNYHTIISYAAICKRCVYIPIIIDSPSHMLHTYFYNNLYNFHSIPTQIAQCAQVKQPLFVAWLESDPP